MQGEKPETCTDISRTYMMNSCKRQVATALSLLGYECLRRIQQTYNEVFAEGPTILQNNRKCGENTFGVVPFEHWL